MRGWWAVGLVAGSAACAPGVCGTGELVTAGDAAALLDDDGDGDADVVELCGTLEGSWAFRRSAGWVSLFLGADQPDNTLESSGEISTYLLPATEVVFLTSRLTAGETFGIEGLAGSGLHKLEGTAAAGTVSSTLLDGTIEVVDGPRPAPGALDEATERWKLSWRLELGDPANGTVLQTWDAEDWVEVSPDDITAGTTPPDYVAP